MAQSGQPQQEEPFSPLPESPVSTTAPAPSSAYQTKPPSLWRKLLGRANDGAEQPQDEAFDVKEDNGGSQRHEADTEKEEDLDPDDPRLVPVRKMNRKVVAGLPRAQTFKRQQSELRDNLMPAELSPAERRGLSSDRRLHSPPLNGSDGYSNPRTSAPDFISSFGDSLADVSISGTTASVEEPRTVLASLLNGGRDKSGEDGPLETAGSLPFMSPNSMTKFPEPSSDHNLDTASMTTSVYDQLIHDDLERIWILNLSMHFRDKSKREKFFITYRQHEHLWRRVTISLDYRASPENSLELDLEHTKLQREKNAKIYEAIRDSLADIQFYDTVTNLKLQTTDGRLHVHVVEDVNEIIHYPTIPMIRHLDCRRVKEREIHFEAHMSGFVYKVRVHGRTLIKKEIPGPDTVDEFLYEINALTQLQDSRYVIELYGIIIDDREEHVKGLLISYAENGTLVDMIYDHDHQLPWPRREKWARQIVDGLSEIHEAGFVQGDFTLSNIVIDANDDAKIIDINRRGCPVGWEPPEATPLIESNQRISMYIGVKSDLYQLGMVLWSLGAQEDEPELQNRPLRLDLDTDCPEWYREIVHICLAENPRHRLQAARLLDMFPGSKYQYGSGTGRLIPHHHHQYSHAPSASFDSSIHNYNSAPIIRTINSPPPEWSYKTYSGQTFVDTAAALSRDPYYFPMRGRSPPSPIASHRSGELYGNRYGPPAWSAYSYEQNRTSEYSASDIGADNRIDDDALRGERSETSWSVQGESLADTELDEGPSMGASLIGLDRPTLETPVIPRDASRDNATPQPKYNNTQMLLTSLAEQFTAPGECSAPNSLNPCDKQPEAIPLPPSPVNEADWVASTASQACESEKNEMDAEGDGGALIWPLDEPHSDKEASGSIGLVTGLPAVDKSFACSPDPKTAYPRTEISTISEVTGMDVPDTDILGGASLTPVAETPETMLLVNPLESPKLEQVLKSLSPRPSSTRSSSPPVLPNDLKGVGSAHEDTNEEMMRTRDSLDDDCTHNFDAMTSGTSLADDLQKSKALSGTRQDPVTTQPIAT
ncbi:hypothetical protein PpBr36_01305 [Pyricularia pennisetigena]|uniref:hypothetical protein n=1 Tax=Pyricularia pennisetigena TaxID=1578925 RepID=UPI001154D31D|nr:hypothetical protein PpBr36_01305 [Pyricularia pennisetigena]TLS29382.1 hypothetical protein PpBr36_01305 [Pyricularia pennisetigena]